MLLYKSVKALLYVLLCIAGICLLAGQKEPRYMAAALATIPVCLLLHWLQKRLWLRANQRMPLVCVQATLVNHRQVYEGRVPAYKASFLTFETELGEHIEPRKLHEAAFQNHK